MGMTTYWSIEMSWFWGMHPSWFPGLDPCHSLGLSLFVLMFIATTKWVLSTGLFLGLSHSFKRIHPVKNAKHIQFRTIGFSSSPWTRHELVSLFFLIRHSHVSCCWNKGWTNRPDGSAIDDGHLVAGSQKMGQNGHLVVPGVRNSLGTTVHPVLRTVCDMLFSEYLLGTSWNQ